MELPRRLDAGEDSHGVDSLEFMTAQESLIFIKKPGHRQPFSVNPFRFSEAGVVIVFEIKCRLP
jgi:hypothetical protein